MFFNDGLCCRRFKSAVNADFCDFPKPRKQKWALKALHIRPAPTLLQREFLSLFQGAKVPTEGRGISSDHP